MDTIQTKKCKHCECEKPITDFPKHPTAKYGVGSSCKACSNEYGKKYRKENQDLRERERVRSQTPERKAQRKVWEAANRQKRREQERARDAADREGVRAKQREWRLKNPEKEKANGLRWREKNRDHLRAKAREYAPGYRAKNLERCAAATRRYRERLAQNGGAYTPEQWTNLKAKYGGRCLACGKQEPEVKVGPDHVIPVSKGGSSDISNIQPLCPRCNSIKLNKIIDYRMLYDQPTVAPC